MLSVAGLSGLVASPSARCQSADAGRPKNKNDNGITRSVTRRVLLQRRASSSVYSVPPQRGAGCFYRHASLRPTSQGSIVVAGIFPGWMMGRHCLLLYHSIRCSMQPDGMGPALAGREPSARLTRKTKNFRLLQAGIPDSQNI